MRIVLTILLLLTGRAAFCQQGLDTLYTRTSALITKGDYVEAAKTNKQLLQLAEQQHNEHYHGLALYKAGELNDMLRNKLPALQYFKQGQALAMSSNDTEVLWLCTRYLGGYYFGENERDSAWHYLNYSYQLIKNTTQYSRIASNAGMLGETQKDLFKDYDKTEYYHKISLENAIKSGDYHSLAYAYYRWGCFWAAKRHNCSYGLKYVNQAYDLFRLHNDIEGVEWTLRSLGMINYLCQEYERSHVAYERLIAVQDSFFTKQVAEKTMQYTVLYETEKKEKENALKDIQLKAEARRRTNLSISFCIAIGLLLTVFYLFYNRYKYKRKLETEMQMADEQRKRYKAVIDAEEKERERIARELHDGVGHLLSSAKLMVSAIEDATTETKDLAEHAMKIMDEALGETRNISHNLMPAALSEIGFAAAVKQMARKIDSAGKVKVQLHNEDGIPKLAQTKAIALYRIIQEVLNNALKHSGAGRISIYFKDTSQSHEIVITDDGKGFDTSSIKDKGGIGWKNIYSRIDMLSGRADVHSLPGEGSRITISFPHD